MIRNYLILALLSVCFVQTGCYNVARLQPVDKDRTDVFFDRYAVEVGGGIQDTSLLTIMGTYQSYTQKHPTTAPADTIPVFIIDSLCLTGACLAENVCVYSDWVAKLVGIFQDTTRTRSRKRVRTDDLGSNFGRYWPHEFVFLKDVRLPASCVHDTIDVAIYARLLDRMSGRVIASEQKTVPCIIKRYRGVSLFTAAESQPSKPMAGLVKGRSRGRDMSRAQGVGSSRETGRSAPRRVNFADHATRRCRALKAGLDLQEMR